MSCQRAIKVVYASACDELGTVTRRREIFHYIFAEMK